MWITLGKHRREEVRERGGDINLDIKKVRGSPNDTVILAKINSDRILN